MYLFLGRELSAQNILQLFADKHVFHKRLQQDVATIVMKVYCIVFLIEKFYLLESGHEDLLSSIKYLR